MSLGKKPLPDTSPPLIRITVGTVPADRVLFEFRKPFRIGRVEDCEVCIKNEFVSRAHAEVIFDNGQWCVRDLGSSNGIYLDGQRVQSTPVLKSTSIRLGVEGPVLRLEVEQPPREEKFAAGGETVIAKYVDHYFSDSTPAASMGEHTMFVRRAFDRVQAKQRWKYGRIMAALVLAIVASASYALYLHQQARKQKAVAQDLFYAMKSLDLDIASVERLVLESNNQLGMHEIQKYQSRRKDMAASYDRFLNTLHVYSSKMTQQERLILRVARIFGECELAMPVGFVPEVENYIKKWQSSGRLARAIRRANDNAYTVKITEELLAQDLPPQFFYLALQESDFDPYTSGPMTRKGIAKGMWQFIPETAIEYGLKIGPLADLKRPDPADDRHHWEKATKAAARYLKFLYGTDAQASGLLVMACYNWGEGRVLPLVRGMPANPKERNFWRLLTEHRDEIPPETYGYVFSIVSAAVIGEDPHLFGFDFENPLAHLESK